MPRGVRSQEVDRAWPSSSSAFRTSRKAATETKIDAIAKAIESTEGVRLLDVDPGADTNRTVITFVGSPEAVAEAAFRAIKRASEVIDMRQQTGAHSRIGATDVCPFIPLDGVTMEECVELARAVGERVGRELGIPIYLYEEAATRPERRNLAEVRKGEYEGLRAEAGRSRLGAGLRPHGLQRDRGRDGDGRARVPHRLQRQPQHQGQAARHADRAGHPRERAAPRRTPPATSSSTSAATR